MDIELRDEHGERWLILPADRSVCQYPRRSRLPDTDGMVVGDHHLPDIVLEVDHPTDVRRGKLGWYESWGFPKVCVEVPERWTPSRPPGLSPRLTVYLLEGDRYRESPESWAFPAWQARAIHEALNESELSGWTHRRLEQLGRTLGERDGTGPDDSPLLRSLRGESRKEGHAAGLAEGLVEGRAKTVRQSLRSHSIEVSAAFPADAPGFTELPEDEAVASALACDGERDFHARIRKP